MIVIEHPEGYIAISTWDQSLDLVREILCLWGSDDGFHDHGATWRTLSDALDLWGLPLRVEPPLA